MVSRVDRAFPTTPRRALTPVVASFDIPPRVLVVDDDGFKPRLAIECAVRDAHPTTIDDDEMGRECMMLASTGRLSTSARAACEVKTFAPDTNDARCVGRVEATCETRCVRWTPTNGALAVAGASGGVHLYKPDESLTLLGTIPEEALDIGQVCGIDFSPGSRYLATGGSAAQEEVAVWDLRRRKKHRVLSGHDSTVNAVRYGQFGRLLGSGSASGVVLVHDVESGAQTARLTPPTLSGVTSIDFSKYSPQHLVSACMDGTVRLWDIEAGQLQSTLTVRGSECYQVEFSPTVPGLLGYVKSDGRVVLQDITSPTPMGALTFKGCQATSMCWHYSGFALAVGTSDGRISWLDTRKISGGADVATCQIYDIKAHDGGVEALSWQHPVPQSFQVEKTPSRGDNIPDSPMTPVAAKSRLLHEPVPAPAPVAEALSRDLSKTKIIQSPSVSTTELESIIENATEKLGDAVRAQVRDLHLELLRQHQSTVDETAQMFAEMRQLQLEMAQEIAQLRSELGR